MKIIKSIVSVCILVILTSCSSCSKDKKATTGKNHLSFKIDGVYWESDESEVFGSYHFSDALGPKLINIAGAKGTGAAQQAFNINLYNTDAEGSYTVNVPNGSTASTYQIVEATFSGTMQCVEGNIVSITEGKFSYHE